MVYCQVLALELDALSRLAPELHGMAAKAAMVSRSQIESARPEIVLALIDSWRLTATELEASGDDYKRMMERPGGQIWSGKTADAAITHAYNDRKEIIRGADAITQMADSAFRGLTESVMSKLTNVRAMIDNAERQGFLVNNDLRCHGLIQPE